MIKTAGRKIGGFCLCYHRRMKFICIALIGVLVPVAALSAPVCPSTQPAGVARITDVMATGRFVAYVPSELRVIDGKTTPASDASLEADLNVLRSRFDGIITYSAHSGTERVPDVAAKLGFRAVIMGIWDINNQTERANVIAAAKRTPRCRWRVRGQ